MRRLLASTAILMNILLLSGCHQPGEIDKVLDQARKDGKVVMLGLDSVDCIPCEQMKPVMQKLHDTYKGKLEVIFVDVRVDRVLAVRCLSYTDAGFPGQEREGIPPAYRVL